jgi:hypothetical protein
MRKINYDAQGIPDRVATGVGEQTIAFQHDHFYGHPDDYTFRSSVMQRYWDTLKIHLARIKCTNVVMGSILVDSHVGGKNSPRSRTMADSFVVVAGDDTGIKVVWHRYSPSNPAGAMNALYSNGQKHAMTAFYMADQADKDSMTGYNEFREMIKVFAAEQESATSN